MAILAGDGAPKAVIEGVRAALEAKGDEVAFVCLHRDAVRLWAAGDWAGSVEPHKTVFETDAAAYGALVLPGGILGQDALRAEPLCAQFVRECVRSGRPVAAFGHGAWALIDAGAAIGRRLTSAPQISLDLINAGSDWVDEPAVYADGLVTGRNEADLPAFLACMEAAFSRARAPVDVD